MTYTRRSFLKQSAAVCLVATCPDFIAMAKSQEPHLQFPTKPIDRLAVTSYPFRASMKGQANAKGGQNKSGMDIVEFAKMAIQKFDIHNINPLLAHFTSTEPDHLKKVRNDIAQAGSRLVGVGLGRGMFYEPDQAARQASVKTCKQWIDSAAVLGSPSVRLHLGATEGVKPDAARAAESLRELAEYSAGKNVVVNLENDNLVNEDPFLIVEIIQKVKNPYLRALPDMGNSLAKGDPEYNYRALKAMFRHAFNMSHVKQDIESDGGKMYKVDLAKTFGIANASGYRGYFSMECESEHGDPFEGTQKLVKESLRYIS